MVTCESCGQPCEPDDAWTVRGRGTCCRSHEPETVEQSARPIMGARIAREHNERKHLMDDPLKRIERELRDEAKRLVAAADDAGKACAKALDWAARNTP